VSRWSFFAALQSDHHDLGVTEDTAHYRIRRESPEAVGISETFLGGVHKFKIHKLRAVFC
jgi:hypothetical protein